MWPRKQLSITSRRDGGEDNSLGKENDYTVLPWKEESQPLKLKENNQSGIALLSGQECDSS